MTFDCKTRQNVEILVNSYSKTELAKICLISLDIIQNKNNLLKQLKESGIKENVRY